MSSTLVCSTSIGGTATTVETAVFTEHGAPSSQMAAAILLDTISRLFLHLSEASRLSRLLEKERPQVWIRLLVEDRTNGIRFKNLRSPTGRIALGQKARSSCQTRLGIALTWECVSVHRKSQLFLFVSVDDIKMVGKREKYRTYVENSTITIRERCISFAESIMFGLHLERRRS